MIKDFLLISNYNKNHIYSLNDLIIFDGGTYIYINKTPSSNSPLFYDYWRKIQEGIVWKDVFIGGYNYKKNDCVVSSNLLFVCVNDNNQPPENNNNWIPFLHPYFYYDGVNDIENNCVFRKDNCFYIYKNKNDIRAISGLVSHSNYYSNYTEYNNNNCVIYEDDVYSCKSDSVIDKTPINNLFWEKQNFKNWESNKEYKTNNYIQHNDIVYICNKNHASTFFDIKYWQKYLHCFNYRGDYNNNEVYNTYDIVEYGNGIYICDNESIGINPLNSSNFTLLIETNKLKSVFNRKGDVIAKTGDYNSLQISHIPCDNCNADNVGDALYELNDKIANEVNSAIIEINSNINLVVADVSDLNQSLNNHVHTHSQITDNESYKHLPSVNNTNYMLVSDTSLPNKTKWVRFKNFYQIKTTSFTAEVFGCYVVNITTPITITLPSNPVVDEIIIFKISGASLTNIVTFNRNGNNIEGIVDNGTTTKNGVIKIIYIGIVDGVNIGWIKSEGVLI